jgi:hypothetical protein
MFNVLKPYQRRPDRLSYSNLTLNADEIFVANNFDFFDEHFILTVGRLELERHRKGGQIQNHRSWLTESYQYQ